MIKKANKEDVVLLLRSLHTPYRDDMQKVISALGSLDQESLVDILIGLLRHEDPEIRCDAAESLVRIDPKKGTSAILPLLSDANPNVRWNTCGLLYDNGDNRATSDLLRILLHDPEGYVRLIAAHTLGRIGDPTAIESLRHAEQHDDGEDYEGRRVANAAREAIELIKGKISGQN